MLFRLTNNTQAQRHVWSHGRQVLVPPGETKVLDMLDSNAIFLRRCQKRGDLLRIEATSDDGTLVLQRADAPPLPRTYPRGLGPGSEHGEIRDGVEEARLKELSKQPDPGMRKGAETAVPVRVPRDE